MIEQAKFRYSGLCKAFGKRVDALKSLNNYNNINELKQI